MSNVEKHDNTFSWVTLGVYLKLGKKKDPMKHILERPLLSLTVLTLLLVAMLFAASVHHAPPTPPHCTTSQLKQCHLSVR